MATKHELGFADPPHDSYLQLFMMTAESCAATPCAVTLMARSPHVPLPSCPFNPCAVTPMCHSPLMASGRSYAGPQGRTPRRRLSFFVFAGQSAVIMNSKHKPTHKPVSARPLPAVLHNNGRFGAPHAAAKVVRHRHVSHVELHAAAVQQYRTAVRCCVVRHGAVLQGHGAGAGAHGAAAGKRGMKRKKAC